ncbi:hypothetical protein PMAYCL1PPCAC_08861, partial [Pristionchus mayeri]
MEDTPPSSGGDADFRVRRAFSSRVTAWGRSARLITPRALATKTLSFFPILQWLPKYKWKVSLFGDLSGGLTMGVFNVPQGIALAAITGVNPVYGLYTAIFPSFFYILFGTSKHNSLGGFAVLSLLTAKAIERMDLEWSEANATAPIEMTAGIGIASMLNLTDSLLGNGTSLYDRDSLLVDDVIKAGPNSIAIATALLFTSGVLQLIFGLVHAHYLTCYFSEQVMSGFIVGGVVHVFFAQIGPALGLDLPIRNGPFYLYYRVSDLIDGFPNIHSPTVVISASSIVFLIVSKELIGPWLDEVFFFPVPFELVLVIVGITATNFAELASRHSIAVVGNMPTNFPVPTAPQFELSFSLFWEALCIAIVATAIHVTVAKYVEKRYDYHIDYGQELYALGFVGVFSSFFPVFPVTSGFQRSVVGAAVGGSTQLTGLFSSVALLSVILYIGPALEYLPKCVLASIMLVSLKNSFLKIRELGQLWPTFKIDAFIYIASMLLTICYDMVQGLLFAVVLAVATTVLRSQWPKWHFLTEDDSGAFRECREGYERGGFIVFRFDGPLLFTSVDRFTQAVNRCISIWSKKRASEFVPMEEMQGDAERLNEKISRFRSRRWIRKQEKTRDDRIHLVVDCTRMPFVDYEGLRTLKKVFKDKVAEGVDIVFVVYQADLLKKFDATDFYEIVGRDKVFTSIEEAVEAGGVKS